MENKSLSQNKLILGDCLEVMKDIEDESIDIIIADLPYSTTRNAWDCHIPLESLWTHYRRIIKPRGCIALFAQTPFDKVLGASNLPMLKYEWIWEKDGPTGHLNSHFAPMKIHENILIFSKAAACYVKDKSHAMKYFPQKTPTKEINNKYYQPTNSKNYDFKNQKTYISSNNGLKHPTDILKFKRDRGLHPTQKPVLLYQYLLETYTEEGDLALDNVAGSCPLAIAAINTNRRFICIEKNEDYFNIGRERVSAHELH